MGWVKWVWKYDTKRKIEYEFNRAIILLFEPIFLSILVLVWRIGSRNTETQCETEDQIGHLFYGPLFQTLRILQLNHLRFRSRKQSWYGTLSLISTYKKTSNLSVFKSFCLCYFERQITSIHLIIIKLTSQFAIKSSIYIIWYYLRALNWKILKLKYWF